MALTGQLPVYIRVGDGKEQQIGTLDTTIDPSGGNVERFQQALAAALRSVADEIDHPGPPLGPGEDDAEVWIPPTSDCMEYRHDRPCPHCGVAAFHHRTRRCGGCGRRP